MVITRQGEPVLVIIDYADYLAIVDALDDARLARRAAEVLADLKAGRTDARPWAEIRREWVVEGVLLRTCRRCRPYESIAHGATLTQPFNLLQV